MGLLIKCDRIYKAINYKIFYYKHLPSYLRKVSKKENKGTVDKVKIFKFHSMGSKAVRGLRNVLCPCFGTRSVGWVTCYPTGCRLCAKQNTSII